MMGHLSPDELVARIRQQTAYYNRNNVTRTAAYLRFYLEFPEVHWAFLAHMVSRNAGWNMTDLRGGLLSSLLSESKRRRLFHFLEQSNALIFHDAYPQLLLYKRCVQSQRDLFHILPKLHVSRFMIPIWKQFLDTKNAVLLTIALIINEQQVVEHGVIRNDTFQKHLFSRLFFYGPSRLQLNQVVFPYDIKTTSGIRQLSANRQRRLAGCCIEDFVDLKERISVGKRLYATLFGFDQVYVGAIRFARLQTHTGSRSDYWPSIFNSSTFNSSNFNSSFISSENNNHSDLIYSPKLVDVWPDQSYERKRRSDWFHDKSAFSFFNRFSFPWKYDMTIAACKRLSALETAVHSAQGAQRLASFSRSSRHEAYKLL